MVLFVVSSHDKNGVLYQIYNNRVFLAVWCVLVRLVWSAGGFFLWGRLVKRSKSRGVRGFFEEQKNGAG